MLRKTFIELDYEIVQMIVTIRFKLTSLTLINAVYIVALTDTITYSVIGSVLGSSVHMTAYCNVEI